MSLPENYRTALVTGASRGIGAEIARTLAGAGLEVLALARPSEALELLAETPGIIPLAADVTRIDDLAALLEGRQVDVLVNNAGAIGALGPLHTLTPRETADVVTLNLIAPLQLTQIVVGGMVSRGHGHVVSLTSAVAHHVFGGTTAYSAAKAGLSMAHQVLRHDLAGSNVRFTEVVPGRVETDFYLEAFGADAGRLKETLYARQRALHPEDIARAVLAALSMPEHVDLSRVEIMPTDQAPGGHAFPTRAAE